MGVVRSADPAYRIATTSQFASMSTVVTRSTEELGAGWIAGSTGVLSATYWADGGGVGLGGPCVAPPSADAAAEIDAMRRQVPKNCVSFDIFSFPFDDALVGNRVPKSAGLY
jgi:hypothetical protein